MLTNVKTLNRLLDKSCEIIISLEQYADESLQKEIDALFNEIKYTDELNWEMDPDQEAQDYDVFGSDKI